MNRHARRHQQQQLIRDDRVETGPLPDDWCVVCQGEGGWTVRMPLDEVEGVWEVCLFCQNGPDDIEGD